MARFVSAALATGVDCVLTEEFAMSREAGRERGFEKVMVWGSKYPHARQNELLLSLLRWSSVKYGVEYSDNILRKRLGVPGVIR